MVAKDRFPKQAQTFTVKELHLHASCIHGPALINFLQCFTSLRQFLYSHGGPLVGYAEFLPQKFGAAIEHVHHCLEKSTRLVGYYEEVYGPEKAEAIGSLNGFKNLREIVMHASTLFGPNPEDEDEGDDEEGSERSTKRPQLVDILPASLEMLRKYLY